jgi:hypothetical protein
MTSDIISRFDWLIFGVLTSAIPHFCQTKIKWGLFVEDNTIPANLVTIGKLVSEEKIEMWKVNRRQMPSDQESSEDSKMAAELMAAWKTAQQFLQFFDVLWSSNAKQFWKDNLMYIIGTEAQNCIRMQLSAWWKSGL